MEAKKIKKGNFVEVDYTGRFKDEGTVFDTTEKEVAIASSLDKESDYKPIVICIGEGFILPALEEELIGKSTGKHSFELQPEQAFGKKSAKLLKLVPMKVFKKQDIMPYLGLDVTIDNQYGIVRNVSGGRVIVDFNHPLSGKDLVYEVKVNKFVTDDKDKVESLLKIAGMHYDSVSVKEKNAMIVLEHDMPVELRKLIDDKVKKMIGIKKIDYVVKKQDKKEKKKK